jgi:hypothetical protein
LATAIRRWSNDIIKLNYSENEFICLWFQNYLPLDPNTFVHTDAATPDLKWINSSKKNSIINNENETHLKYFF